MNHSELAAIVRDRLLRALLESGCVPDQALERLLTLLRFAVLERATAMAGHDAFSPDELEFYSALARLCFISDYVFDCTPNETELAASLRERLVASVAIGNRSPRHLADRRCRVFSASRAVLPGCAVVEIVARPGRAGGGATSHRTST